MMVLQTFTHASQMCTPGPAMIFFTSDCDFPQNEQRVMRDDLAMGKECYRLVRLSSVQKKDGDR